MAQFVVKGETASEGCEEISLKARCVAYGDDRKQALVNFDRVR